MIDEKLISYMDENVYPFHMPGHKRISLKLPDVYKIDITEITDFDDLHDPKGPILELEERLALLYDVSKAWFLVNGTTVGILSAILAMTKDDDHILIARNCHRSVYHAAMLNRLRTSYILPEFDENGIASPISVNDIKFELNRKKDIKLVVITSPTYEGIVSDIPEIAKIVHESGALLLVDSAHGAHLGMSKFFPENAAQQGADVVVESLHKSLPFLTQSACLLQPRENEELSRRIRENLSYLETSSPSYVFMAAAARGIEFLEKNGPGLFNELNKNLVDFYDSIKKDSKIGLLKKKGHDLSKIIILSDNYPGGGIQLEEDLKREANIELEMSSFEYCIALASIMDTKEGFERLKNGLIAISRNIKIKKAVDTRIVIPSVGQQKMNLSKAMQSDIELVEVTMAENRICAGFIGMYPPGTILVAPGEIVTRKHVNLVEYALKKGYHIRGLHSERFPVVKK